MIGIEISPDLVRGVRIGKRSASVEVPVEKGREAEALENAIRKLGGGLVRISFRSVPGATTRFLDGPLRSVTDHVPIAARELAWQGVPLPGGKTFLVAVSKANLEETLDTWGITERFTHGPEGVGITGAAFVSLADELPPDATLLWADAPRYLLLERRSGFVVRFDAPDAPAAADFVTGPSAEAVASSFPRSRIHRPGGLDPKFALAYGAAHWGEASFPTIPNLEPIERRKARVERARSIRASRLARAASVAMLLAAAGIAIPSRLARADAERDLITAETNRTTTEAEFHKAAASLGGVRPAAGEDPGRRIAGILSRVAEVQATAREIRYEASPAGPYPGLGAGGGSVVVIEGIAKDLGSIDRLRASLGDAEVEESARTGAGGVRFRMRIK